MHKETESQPRLLEISAVCDKCENPIRISIESPAKRVENISAESTPTQIVREALEYIRDWQEKDGVATLEEVATEALSALEGCVVVPIIPTNAMHHAGYERINEALEIGGIATCSDVYRTMIAPYVGRV